MTTLIFATSNAHKVDEIKAFFADTPFTVQSLLDFPDIPEAPEPFETFHQNAESKAKFVQQYTHGMVIADDSGLVVDALDGQPGVFSKRYSQEGTAEANNAKLLSNMQDVSNRTARFVCVFAIVDQEGTQYIEGICEGSIATEYSGHGGFGYDPIFLPREFVGRSMAELSMAEKNSISHRGRALQQFKRFLLKEF